MSDIETDVMRLLRRHRATVPNLIPFLDDITHLIKMYGNKEAAARRYALLDELDAEAAELEARRADT